jgi:hypothetical protein
LSGLDSNPGSQQVDAQAINLTEDGDTYGTATSIHPNQSFKPFKHELNLIIQVFHTSVRTSQETHYVSATKPNRLMLFRETVAVYCENIRNTQKI